MRTLEQNTAIADIEEKVTRFMRGELGRTAWLENDIVRIYVRHSMRMLGNKHAAEEVFDVASISIAENHRGQGLVREVFDMLEKLVGNKRPIYVENVLSRSLGRLLKERGYKTRSLPGDIGGVPSMYRAVPSHSHTPPRELVDVKF